MIKIGFIGTGLMGLPMATNILKAGYSLKAFNRSREKADPLKNHGAKISTTIKEVVSDSDFIITMLTDDTAIDAVMNNVLKIQLDYNQVKRVLSGSFVQLDKQLIITNKTMLFYDYNNL